MLAKMPASLSRFCQPATASRPRRASMRLEVFDAIRNCSTGWKLRPLRWAADPASARAADERRFVPPHAPGDHAPDEQHDHRPDHRAEQPGTLAGAVPTDGLAEVRRHQGADDAQDRGHDEPARLVPVTRHEELGDDTGHEADDDGPQYLH